MPTYRVLKALTEFTGVVLVGIMWAEGALQAKYAALVIGGIIFGAEIFETFLQRQGAKQQQQQQQQQQ